MKKETSERFHEAKKRKREFYSDSTYIPYPTRYSEAEIQCFLLNSLINLNLDARAEVTSQDRRSRFDIVIFREHKAIRIIEVKSSEHNPIEYQTQRYCRYGVPVDQVKGMEKAKIYLGNILEWIALSPMTDDKTQTDKIKIEREGQPCRKCGEPVIRIIRSNKVSKKKKYYFKSYFKCPGCYTLYMIESEKVYTNLPLSV
jgi:hypothetical protein